MKKFLVILISIVFLVSCEEDSCNCMDPDIFTIRIIENAETGACKDLTKENNLVFSEEPLITLADISY